jgi:hypothetical protein
MKRALASVLGALLLYVGSYVPLSKCGCYAPHCWGLNGIKDWAWTPCGFVSGTGQYRLALFALYLPLYRLDIRFWHDDWTGRTGPSWMPPRTS